MQITFECPACHVPQRTELGEQKATLDCVACSAQTRVRDGALDGAAIKACAVCGTTDLYLQKDFPHRVGLAIVLVGFVGSSIAWANYLYPVAIGILMVTAVLDLLLFYFVGTVLVCYRCLARYRGALDSAHQPFDLAIGERYRQERIRLELLRKASGEGRG